MLDMQSVLLGNLSNEVYRGLNASRNVGTWTTPRGLPIVLQTRQRPTLSGQKFSPSKIDLTTEIKSNYSNSFPKLKMLAEWSIGIWQCTKGDQGAIQLQHAATNGCPFRASLARESHIPHLLRSFEGFPQQLCSGVKGNQRNSQPDLPSK